MSKPKKTVSQIKRLMDEWDFESNNAAGIFPNEVGSQSNVYAYWKCNNRTFHK